MELKSFALQVAALNFYLRPNNENFHALIAAANAFGEVVEKNHE